MIVGNGREQLTEVDAAHLAALLDELEPPEADPYVRDPRAVRRERLSFARSVIRWGPSPEMLARWLAVAVPVYGVRGAGQYLRRTVEGGGDPGTLLSRHGGGEQALYPEHEAALLGDRAREVAGLVAATAAVVGADGDAREQLATQLRDAIDAGDLAVARVAVLALLDGLPAHPLRVARIAERVGVEPERITEALAA